jgi:phospholipase/carboxylesterase
MGNRISRRHFGTLTGRLVATCAAGVSCVARTDSSQSNDGRLTSRPPRLTPPDAAARLEAATRPLELDSTRDALLRLPAGPVTALRPLCVMLHGAGGNAERFLNRMSAMADAAGVALLVPQSRGPTWDAIRSGFGPDVTFINRALDRAFATIAVDPARVSIGGFSDGATYALSLGLVNGDLFRKILAFSPGFVVDGTPLGRPEIFISHGRADTVLPIDRCSRRIVPSLRQRGYDVRFREFDGGHEVPQRLAEEAISWSAE